MLPTKSSNVAGMTGFAFILHPADGTPGDEVPQIRLMMNDGKRIKLILDPHQPVGEAVGLMKELSTRNFFIC
jgi:hypothetical protein